MCPSPASTRHSVPGLKRSMSDPNVQGSIRTLLAHIEALENSESSGIVVNGSLPVNCLLPLNPSQSRLLAALVTIFVPHSTWWSTRERNESWVLFGELGEASGPQVTVCITATSDRDVVP